MLLLVFINVVLSIGLFSAFVSTQRLVTKKFKDKFQHLCVLKDLKAKNQSTWLVSSDLEATGYSVNRQYKEFVKVRLRKRLIFFGLPIFAIILLPSLFISLLVEGVLQLYVAVTE